MLTIKKPPGVKDVAYEVEASPSLAPANWSVDSVTVLTNSTTLLRVSINALDTAGFLRLRVRFVSP